MLVLIQGAGLALCALLVVFHLEGIREFQADDSWFARFFITMHVLVLILQLVGAAYFVNKVPGWESLVRWAFLIVPAWYSFTSFSTGRFIWHRQGLSVIELLKDVRYFTTDNPPVQAMIRSLRLLMLALLTLIPLFGMSFMTT